MTEADPETTHAPAVEGRPGYGRDQNRALTGVARGGTFALGGTTLAAVLGFALTFVVTRGLSTSTAGEFFSVTAVFLVLQTFVAFGVAAGVVRFVPRYFALDRAGDVPTLLLIAIVPVTCAALVVAVVLWFAAPRLAATFSAGSSDSVLASFRLLALFLVPAVLETAVVESTRAFRSITSYVLIQQITLPLARPLLVLLAISTGAPLAGVVLAWAAPLLVGLALAAVVVGRTLRARYGGSAWYARTTSVGSITREYWAFTIPRGVSAAIDIALTWLDVLLVAALVSPADAAIYAAASRFVTTGTLALQAMRLAAAPEISAALARQDREHASALYRVTTQWVILSSWPLYLVLALFGPWILGLFGPGYQAGAASLAVLSVAMMFALAAGNVGSVLLMGGRSLWVLGDKVVVLAVNIAANLLLIPRYGILGAALAWALSIVVDNIVALVQVHHGMKVSSRGRGMVLAMALSVACFGVVGLIARLALGATLLGLTAALLVGSTTYALLIWRNRRPLDLSLLRSSLRVRARTA